MESRYSGRNYMFTLNKEISLDARALSNETRFLNHAPDIEGSNRGKSSRTANCSVHSESLLVVARTRMWPHLCHKVKHVLGQQRLGIYALREYHSLQKFCIPFNFHQIWHTSCHRYLIDSLQQVIFVRVKSYFLIMEKNSSRRIWARSLSLLVQIARRSVYDCLWCMHIFLNYWDQLFPLYTWPYRYLTLLFQGW